MPDLVAWATEQVDLRLSPLGRRAEHVRSAGALAAEIATTVVGEQAGTLVAATLLHDIGYAPELALTGFHPMDGARFVQDHGLSELASLVAHHTGARHEAKLRGLNGFLAEYPFEDSRLHRALTYCDLVTAPDGRRTTVAKRVAEIVRRYGSGHVVSRSALLSLPTFLAIEAEIDALISRATVRG
jgi:hypothetical protein